MFIYIYIYIYNIQKRERIKDRFTVYKVYGKVDINSYFRC